MVEIHKYFAGSNSGLGFYSFFDQIIGPEAKRIYLLKGGPGTGKSYFMKKIAKALEEEGVGQELFYCSSDPGSLDAVTFPELGVALMDATAPHVREPEWPGCRDEILNLGLFWSSSALELKREEIIKRGLAKRLHFDNAFRYFAAALALEQTIEHRNRGGGQVGPVQSNDLWEDLHAKAKSIPGIPGQRRHLFASALTPEGYVSQIQNLAGKYSKRQILVGPRGSGQAAYLEQVADQAQVLGFSALLFHDPLNPKNYLHLFLPELDFAALTSTSYESLAELGGTILQWDPGMSSERLNNRDEQLLQELVAMGIDELQEARAGHGEIEEYYSQTMDFQGLTNYRQEILAEILSYKKRS